MRAHRSLLRWLAGLLVASLAFGAAAPVARAQDPGGTSSGLTHSGSLWERLRVPVCWENPGADAIERGWVQDAVETSWDAVSDIDFVGWGRCRSRSDGIRIEIADENPHTKGLGRLLDGVGSGMVLNFSYRDWGTNCQTMREFCIRTIAVHEFGHGLGFAHEHNRDDRFNCDIAHQGTEPTYYITPFDEDSVMNYCNGDWSNNGALSKLDVAGVRAVYGPFDDVVPARLTVETTVNITDGELGANEHASRRFVRRSNLTTGATSASWHHSLCAGGEVRVITNIDARLLPGTSVTSVTATARMFEGSTCRTTDLEDTDHAVEEVRIGTDETRIRLRLVNETLVGSDDRATISIRVTRDVGAAVAGGCADCDAAADASSFAEFRPPVWYAKVDPPTQLVIGGPFNPTIIDVPARVDPIRSDTPDRSEPTVDRVSPGRYTVTLPGFGAVGSGNVQVTPQGVGDLTCSILRWFGDHAQIRCRDRDGADADASFIVAATGDRRDAFAWAGRPTSSSYRAPAPYSNNPGGQPTTVTRTDIGVYAVRFQGLEHRIRNAVVSAYATPARCVVRSWGRDTVDVRCRDAAGDPADAAFSVLATTRRDHEAYAWNRTGAGATVAAHSWAPNGAPAISRLDRGRYRVDLPDTDRILGGVLVSTYRTAATCRAHSSTVQTVVVTCHNDAGRPRDSQFSVRVLEH